MPLVLGWPDIAWRLGLTFLAALLVGLNRGGRGEAACCQPAERIRRYEFIVRWRARRSSAEMPGFVEALAREAGVRDLRWLPDSVTSNVTDLAKPR
jgi:hypothetical protein